MCPGPVTTLIQKPETGMDEKVRCEVNEKGVAVVTISNPPMNALDDVTMLRLEYVFRQIEHDKNIKAVIITGDGDKFVIGADVNKVQEIDTFDEGVRVTERAHEILDLIHYNEKPVIAAINGACFGGGLELAMACHIRLAADSAQLALPEIMLGIIPAFGGTQRASRLIGTGRALEMMLTGRFVPAEEAEKWGLVNRVVAGDSLMDEALNMAKQISYKSTLAVGALLEAVIDGVDLPLDEGLELESECFGRLAESEDKIEGISAFLEKRKPEFKGR